MEIGMDTSRTARVAGAPTRVLRALILDVDGPLADTGEARRRAFNEAFLRAGLAWQCDEPTWSGLARVRCERERIARFRAARSRRDHHAVDAQVLFLHRLQVDAFDRIVRDGGIAPRPGAVAMLESARAAGLRLGIVTEAEPAHLDALLRPAFGRDWHEGFDAVEHGASVPRRRPHPQAHLKALERLGVPAEGCLAFEASADGLKAARAAGIAAVAAPGRYAIADAFDGSPRVLGGFASVSAADLRDWHGRTLH
jgi:beta-phosphoglucomutase-like phosphatase (HAD superfamily)